MVGLVRAAAYSPGADRPGPARAAADEDLFTLAATALERVLPDPVPSGAPIPIDLVGDFDPAFDWAFPVLLGTPVALHREVGGPAGLRRALERAEPAGGPAHLVVLAELPSRRTGPTAVANAEDGAVAFLLGDGGTAIAGQLPPPAEGTSSGLPEARAVRRALGEAAPSARWIGDWEPGSERQIDVGAPPAETRFAVSEGAYVSRPRYLENLPSRWRFEAEECPFCGTTTFPARGRCRGCGSREGLRSRRLPRDDALVVAATVIGPGGQPTEFDPQVTAQGGYGVVLAELAPGQRVTLQVTDAEPGRVRIGDRVDTRLRRLYATEGEWRYGRKAVPRATESRRGPS